MTWRSLFNPGFVAVRSLLQVCQELLIRESLTTLLDGGFDSLPDPEKLAAGLKEQVFVEQTIVEQGTGLIPIAEPHHGECAGLRPWRRNSHGVIKIVREIILRKPIARLP